MLARDRPAPASSWPAFGQQSSCDARLESAMIEAVSLFDMKTGRNSAQGKRPVRWARSNLTQFIPRNKRQNIDGSRGIFNSLGRGRISGIEPLNIFFFFFCF